MGTTLDGQNLFDEQYLDIEAGSTSRDSIERTIPGLDGVLSLDLGGRSRHIRQRGVLRAKSRFQMDDKIVAISAHMDGTTHTLVTGDGKIFDNLRMDAFKIIEEEVSGDGLRCDYEIIYTQLAV